MYHSATTAHPKPVYRYRVINSRDIKRRIDVAMKKVDSLRELGVPCAVCYVSHWTKGLMVYGDSRMTNVISNQAATMLQELENSEEPEPHDRGLFLPPIPAPLKDLNFRTMQSMIIALATEGCVVTLIKLRTIPVSVSTLEPK